MRVIGFDPSLTSFGVSDGAETFRVRSEPTDGDEHARVAQIYAQIARFVAADSRDLVFVIEGPSFGSGRGKNAGSAQWTAGYLRAHFDTMAAAFRATVHIVSPATLKKFVIGNGGAGKRDMLVAAFKKWQIEFKDDPMGDKLDAYCLHRYGLEIAAGRLSHTPPKPRGENARKKVQS